MTTTRRLASLLLVACGLLALQARPAQAKLWEDRDLNVLLRIPDDPAPWDWMPYSSDWKRYDIVKGAQRVLDELKNGQPAKGEGAILHLAVRDAPEGATLEGLAADEKTRSFLLARFEKGPEVEGMTIDLEGDVPAALLAADGTARNLRGTVAPCRGVMILAIVKDKLYLLRMYAWHTEYDREGLKEDLDVIELDGLAFFDVSSGASTAPPPDADGGDDGGDEPAQDMKEEVFEFPDQLFRMVKHEKLKSTEIDKRQARDLMILKFEDNDRFGSYGMYLYATPNSRIINGQTAPPENIRKGITVDWYEQFISSHPEGAIYRFDWPRKPTTDKKKRTFLVLPDLSDEERIEVFGEDRKGADKVSGSDVTGRRLRIVEKVKRGYIGEQKFSEAFRGNLQGNYPKVGKNTILRYSWRTKSHAYRLILNIARDGYQRWGDAIRATLESFTFYDKWPKTR